MLVLWLAGVGWSADPAPKPAPAPKPGVVTEIEVVPQFLQGSVMLTMPGRAGDAVYVDGWNAGILPVQTDLAEGPHTFRVEGVTGRHEVSIYVTVAVDKVTTLDLSLPMASPPEPPVPTLNPKK